MSHKAPFVRLGHISSVVLCIFHSELLLLKISILFINTANNMIAQASNHNVAITQ